MARKKKKAAWSNRGKTQTERVLEFMKAKSPEPVSYQDIHAQFGDKIGNPRSVISQLRKQGSIQDLENGLFLLVGIDPPEEEPVMPEPAVSSLPHVAERESRVSIVLADAAEVAAEIAAPVAPDWLVKGFDALAAAIKFGGLEEISAQQALWSLVRARVHTEQD